MEDAAGMVLISTTNVVTLPAPPSSCSSCCCCSVCHLRPPLCTMLRAERSVRRVLSWPSVCRSSCVPVCLLLSVRMRVRVPLKSVHVCTCEIIAVFESLHIQAAAHFTWLNYENQT
jgi:hypothetical protein